MIDAVIDVTRLTADVLLIMLAVVVIIRLQKFH